MAIIESKTNNAITLDSKDRSKGLQEHDVVCEKGRGDHERWAGNMLYRFLINENKDSYNDLTPMERSTVIGRIINTIKEKGGWFVQTEGVTGAWVHLSEEKVRKKVSDDLRREVRRRREKRSSTSAFNVKLKALKKKEKDSEAVDGLLKPVDDPRETDVLFGPGARRHPGNKTYWGLMKANLNHYIISPYGARSMISRSIVQGIRERNGRFLEQDPKTSVWYEISDKRAIEKTSHALSNKKYKSRKRSPGELSSPSNFKSSTETDSAFDEDSSFSSTPASSISSSSSVENMENTQVRAKKGSKKFKLLQRMDGLSDESNEDASSIESIGAPRENTPPSSPFTQPGTTLVEGKAAMVSPGDSKVSPSDKSRDDTYDFDERNAIHTIHQMRMRRAPAIITGHDMHDYVYHKRAGIEMESPRVTPRYSHYIDEEQYATERVVYEPSPSPYHSHMHDRSPTYRHYIRRVSEPISPREVDYVLSPKGRPHHLSPPSIHEHRILKPSSYRVNEWGNTPAPRRHVYEY